MGGSRVLGDITQPNVESRFLPLAVAVEALIDASVHPDEKILRGTLLMKIVSSGKYRAYAEADVATGGDFSTGADTFTLEDQDSKEKMKHFRVGDVIEGTDGTALGTIATFNATTGVGTLTANSSNNYAAGNGVRVATSVATLASQAGRILKSETTVETGQDEPVAAYIEGFFNKNRVIGATAAAITALGATEPTTDEIRLK